MAPGEELYTSFGHTAIWVDDPATGIDNVYNYGTFDFRTGNFYWKFIRGTLPYILSVYPLRYSMAEAQGDNRSLTEQVLNLSPEQKQRLFDFLQTNARPENRGYRYKFYYDNCASRPRDVLKLAVGSGFRWTPVPELEGKSFRRWMNNYLRTQPFARLGMNLAIGQPADETATFEQAMYLPDNLMKAVAKARNGDQPLVSATNELFVAQPVARGIGAGYLQLVLLLLLLPVGVWLYRKHSDEPFWLDKTLLLLAGSVGLILTFLWFGTDHGVPDWNASLLIYSPTHLVAGFLLRKRPHFRWLLWYCLVFGLLAAAGFALTAMESHTYFVEILLMTRLFQLRRFYHTQTTQPAPVHEA